MLAEFHHSTPENKCATEFNYTKIPALHSSIQQNQNSFRHANLKWTLAHSM